MICLRVLVTPRSFGKSDPEVFQILKRAGFDLVLNTTGAVMTAQQLGEGLADCDGIIVGIDPLSKDVLAGAPRLRAIAKYGVGVDNIDLQVCREKGIKVSRTIGANTDAVADFAFSLMMAVARQVTLIDRQCRQGDWSKLTTADVHGKTLGILGLGAIGKAMARRARGFDMVLLGHDPVWDEDFAKACDVQRSSAEAIYRQADFITLHMPLLPETQKMIGREQLAMMKPSAILINTARGGLIDEPALLDALQNKRIYGAGIDAFAKEPPDDPAWYTLDHVVLGSHAAASTQDAAFQMGRMAAANLIRDLTAP